MTQSSNSPTTELILLGTIHSSHYENEKYGPSKVQDILLALRPAVVCVELYSLFFDEEGCIRPEYLHEGSDCPETLAIHQAATQMGIRELPYDIEGRNEFFAETNYFERERRASELAEKLFDASALNEDEDRCRLLLETVCRSQHWLNLYAPPNVINSSEYDDHIVLKRQAEAAITEVCARYPEASECVEFGKFSDAHWQERNGVMADNLRVICAQHAGQRVVATMGCEHRYILRGLLADDPAIVLREYWEITGV